MNTVNRGTIAETLGDGPELQDGLGQSRLDVRASENRPVAQIALVAPVYNPESQSD